MRILLLESDPVLSQELQDAGHVCRSAAVADLMAGMDADVVIASASVGRQVRSLLGPRPYILVRGPVEHRARLLCDGVDGVLERPQDLQSHLHAAQRIAEAEARVAEAEQDKQRFCGEVIRIATQDRVLLVERHEIPRRGVRVALIRLTSSADLAVVRGEVRTAGQRIGMDDDALNNFLVAVGEAATNALVHADKARCEVRIDTTGLQCIVSDEGRGISLARLPASVLQAGYSTSLSLGAGFDMMRNLADRVWLATGTGGTVVALTKLQHHPDTTPTTATESLLHKLDAAEARCNIAAG